jgi:hypothetical protein
MLFEVVDLQLKEGGAEAEVVITALDHLTKKRSALHFHGQEDSNDLL